MSFKDCLGEVPRESGHDTFHDALGITLTTQGTDRFIELIEKYPVLAGMLDALGEQAQLDEAQGVVTKDQLDSIYLGFGMALGAIALIAESEIPDVD